MTGGGEDALRAPSRTAGVQRAPSEAEPYDGVPETRVGTAVTAEIPAVPVAPSYGVLLPDGSVWYPGSKRKLPAPLALRVTVWALAFLVAIGAAFLLVEHYHPSWLDPVRRTAGAVNSGGPSPIGPAPTVTTARKTAKVSDVLRTTSQTATGTTFALSGPAYSLAITTSARCYVVVHSLATNVDLLNNTLAAGTTKIVRVTGSSTLYVAAGGASLSVIDSHGKTIGKVTTLKIDPYLYTFDVPPNS